jgi:uncharacterized repeat protein (TIGR03943 family)
VAAVTAAGGTITLLVGAVLLRLTLTDTHLRYVRPELGPWLLVAALAVVVLGASTLVWSLRHGDDPDPNAHDHEHGVGPGWLLLAPIAALLLVAPPTLGAYGLERAVGVDITAGAPVFEPLARDAPPRPMGLLEFSQRAFEGNGSTFNGAAVQLTGFVAGAEEPGFRLARYQIACCAADASPVVVRVVGTAGDPPSLDQWVTVTGTFNPGREELPELAATSVVEIPAPDDPYE